jgi:hypothetical protein
VCNGFLRPLSRMSQSLACVYFDIAGDEQEYESTRLVRQVASDSDNEEELEWLQRIAAVAKGVQLALREPQVATVLPWEPDLPEAAEVEILVEDGRQTAAVVEDGAREGKWRFYRTKVLEQEKVYDSSDIDVWIEQKESVWDEAEFAKGLDI